MFALVMSACGTIWGFQDPGDLEDAGADAGGDVTGEAMPPRPDAADAAEAGKDGEADAQEASDTRGPDVAQDAPDGEADGASDAPSLDAEDAVDALDAQDATDVLDAGDTSDALPGEAGVPSACAPSTVDLTQIFVSPTGAVNPSCGALASPCGSVQTGLDHAHQQGKSFVYVAPAVYSEAITLYSGVALVGGWTVNGSTWTKDTAPTANQDVVIQPVAPNNVTMTATNLGGAATLCTVTLQSKPTALPFETLYGVFVTGTPAAATDLSIYDVSVVVSAGGDAPAAGTGAMGANGAGTCSAQGGMPGGTGTVGAPGMASFAGTGFVRGDGQTGGIGQTGQNGQVGGAGMCINGTACNLVVVICNMSSVMNASCGGTGLSGCGGPGGGGGPGGQGGGSSIGVFAYGQASVQVASTVITTGAGGKGTAGGPGGGGGPGSSGAVGPAGPSTPTGTCVAGCVPSSSNTGPGGIPGGQGGTGGTGGPGGSGSGGSSCGYVQGPNASVNMGSGNVTMPGAAGAGAPGAADGESNQICS